MIRPIVTDCFRSLLSGYEPLRPFVRLPRKLVGTNIVASSLGTRNPTRICRDGTECRACINRWTCGLQMKIMRRRIHELRISR